ncbi:conserved hypothetical protein [Ricinus communis]|uniref:Uncharacterized protein n=1 Tax=Ricinus communis TaxID=3988 RepID=B9T5Q5_RICCO|nr:conserved hypothetical protein [Ricinus communis]
MTRWKFRIEKHSINHFTLCLEKNEGKPLHSELLLSHMTAVGGGGTTIALTTNKNKNKKD